MAVWVAPFFRASVAITPAERRLFSRSLPAAIFEAQLRRSDPLFRQNLRRVFAAARLAHAERGRLLFVEGFRSNRLIPPAAERGQRFVSGSWVFALTLRLLQRRGLVIVGARPLRQTVSRCTAEEAAAIAGVVAAGDRVVGVADAPCPSASRARRYLSARLATARVVTPEDALAAAGPLSAEQASFWRALAPRASERWLAPVAEAPNWILHGVSEVLRPWLSSPPLEVRLARRLRADR